VALLILIQGTSEEQDGKHYDLLEDRQRGSEIKNKAGKLPEPGQVLALIDGNRPSPIS
jgi:hypothetical protein